MSAEPEVEVPFEVIPEDCIRFWPREAAPPWVFDLIDAREGPSKGFVGYIPARFTAGIPVVAAFPWGRVDRTDDGGYVIQMPEWPVVTFARSA